MTQEATTGRQETEARTLMLLERGGPPKWQATFHGFVPRLTVPTDDLRMVLTDRQPARGQSVDTIGALPPGAGYPAGGEAFRSLDEGWFGARVTASGGSIGPFRFVALCLVEDGAVLGYFDYGSSVTLADGETFTLYKAPLPPGLIGTTRMMAEADLEALR